MSGYNTQDPTVVIYKEPKGKVPDGLQKDGKNYYANTYQKIVILISDGADFRIRKITRIKKGHSITFQEVSSLRRFNNPTGMHLKTECQNLLDKNWPDCKEKDANPLLLLDVSNPSLSN